MVPPGRQDRRLDAEALPSIQGVHEPLARFIHHRPIASREDLNPPRALRRLAHRDWGMGRCHRLIVSLRGAAPNPMAQGQLRREGSDSSRRSPTRNRRRIHWGYRKCCGLAGA